MSAVAGLYGCGENVLCGMPLITETLIITSNVQRKCKTGKLKALVRWLLVSFKLSEDGAITSKRVGVAVL